MEPTITTNVQLLGPPKSTNFFHLKFPLICRKIQRGENVFYLDSTRLGDYFDVRGLNVAELSTALCDKLIPTREHLAPKKRVDPVERLVSTGDCAKTELSRTNQSWRLTLV